MPVDCVCIPTDCVCMPVDCVCMSVDCVCMPVDCACLLTVCACLLTVCACLQEAHISKLKEGLDAGGDASLQNGLDLAVSALKSVPPYGHREVRTSDKLCFYPFLFKYSKKESHPCSALKTCCSKLCMMQSYVSYAIWLLTLYSQLRPHVP